jgi:hypothetical protein
MDKVAKLPWNPHFGPDRYFDELGLAMATASSNKVGVLVANNDTTNLGEGSTSYALNSLVFSGSIPQGELKAALWKDGIWNPENSPERLELKRMIASKFQPPDLANYRPYFRHDKEYANGMSNSLLCMEKAAVTDGGLNHCWAGEKLPANGPLLAKIGMQPSLPLYDPLVPLDQIHPDKEKAKDAKFQAFSNSTLNSLMADGRVLSVSPNVPASVFSKVMNVRKALGGPEAGELADWDD